MEFISLTLFSKLPRFLISFKISSSKISYSYISYILYFLILH